MSDPVEALFTREALTEIRDAIDTGGIGNVELLCYVSLLGLRIVIERALEEMDNVERRKSGLAVDKQGAGADHRRSAHGVGRVSPR